VLSLEQRWISLLNILLTCLFNLFCLNIIPKKRNGKSGHLWDREPWSMRKTWSSCHHHCSTKNVMVTFMRSRDMARGKDVITSCHHHRSTAGSVDKLVASRCMFNLRGANYGWGLKTKTIHCAQCSQMHVKVWSPSHHNRDGNPCNKIGKEKF
jgi:hypothetical protein